MKPISFLLVLVMVLACNPDKKGTAAGKQENNDSVQAVTKEANEEASGDRSESLANMAPLSGDEMKELLPKQIMGADRSEEDVNSAMGAMAASAEYAVTDSTRVELVIIDCAGPGGVGIYSQQYLAMLDLKEEDDEEYTRTVDFQGGKAFENCSKNRVECSLTWFSGRFLVSVEGNLAAEKLRQIAEAIKL